MCMSFLRMHTYISICWPGSRLSLNGLFFFSFFLSFIQTQKLLYGHMCTKKLKLKCYKTRIDKSIFMLYFFTNVHWFNLHICSVAVQTRHQARCQGAASSKSISCGLMQGKHSFVPSLPKKKSRQNCSSRQEKLR